MAGFVIYNGPSQLDGAPIVVVVIDASTNRKTGDMLQTYILRADVAPLDALKTGADASICGGCKHRPISGGACYVNVGQGPRSVYAALQRGRYPDAFGAAAVRIGTGRMVRLGTYGDPSAVPVHVWRDLTRLSTRHTGYTHQWKTLGAADLRDLCMASADSESERAEAAAAGWRTFRVRRPSDDVSPREFVCPASEEAGKRRTCATCGACNGTARSASAASPVIIAHGAKASRFIRIGAAA